MLPSLFSVCNLIESVTLVSLLKTGFPETWARFLQCSDTSHEVSSHQASQQSSCSHTEKRPPWALRSLAPPSAPSGLSFSYLFSVSPPAPCSAPAFSWAEYPSPASNLWNSQDCWICCSSVSPCWKVEAIKTGTALFLPAPTCWLSDGALCLMQQASICSC